MRKHIKKKFLHQTNASLMLEELYFFFSITSSFVILLFTAMEATINRGIPRDFIYRRVTKKSTESFTKTQIEQYLSFEEKVNHVLPVAIERNFKDQFPMKYQFIQNLKNFRDMIVHTKEAEEDSTYEHLYKSALTFKYTDTINAVKDFCNFMEGKSLIEECSCDKEW